MPSEAALKETFSHPNSLTALLEKVLGNCEEFKLLAMRKSGFISTGYIKVMVCDSNDELILSTLLEKDSNGRCTGPGSTISFVDTRGNALLTCKELGNTVMVTGDRHLGNIEKSGDNVLTFPSKFEALNEIGENMFVARRDAGEFKFFSGKSVIAIACHRKIIHGKACSLKFLCTLDTATKAMLLATSTLIDILFFPVNDY